MHGKSSIPTVILKLIGLVAVWKTDISSINKTPRNRTIMY